MTLSSLGVQSNDIECFVLTQINLGVELLLKGNSTIFKKLALYLHVLA